MPKVLQIVNRLNIGGITYNAASIAACLKPEYETMLVTGIHVEGEESSEFVVKQLGVDPIYIRDMSRSIHPLKDYRAYRHILKIIREFKPDIVQTHAAKAGIVGRLAAWRAGVPVILHTYHGHVFHSYFGKFKTLIILTIERLLARISTGIIAISSDQKRELGEIYKIAPLSKIHIIELGYDLAPFSENKEEKRRQFRKEYHLDEDTIAIGIIGRVVPIKNIRFFIASFSEIRLRFPEKKIIAFIIGDGEERPDIQELCREKQLPFSCPEASQDTASVIFTSWIYEVATAMAGLDIIALTSLNEGTPASLIEAQAAGKAIVTTGVGGIPNIIRPGITALMVNGGDLNGFTEALASLIQSPERREEMGKAGPEFVNSRFHYKRLTSDIQKLYTKLLNQVKDRTRQH